MSDTPFVTVPHRIGTLLRSPDFPSNFIPPRPIEIWLPPDYDREPDRRFPVLYMHDGQNVWHPAFNGLSWNVDSTITELALNNEIVSPIVVAIPNHPRHRYQEYLPEAPTHDPTAYDKVIAFSQERQFDLTERPVASDDYLRFLVEELKPVVDATLRTLPDQRSTAIMGSSMGGLISLYALIQYPSVFGGAGCLSTHWVAADGLVVDWLPGHLPSSTDHRIYFDHGTEGLDALYGPLQQRVDAYMRTAGYREGENWVTRVFPGADHREDFWAERLAIPLRFLFGMES